MPAPTGGVLPRRFLIVGHQATTDPAFSLNDLAGGTGRIDVMVRAVTSALCRSHGVREDTVIWLVLPGRDGDGSDGPRTIRIDGAGVRSLNPDERSTAALIKKALAVDVVPNGVFEDAHPGIQVAEMPALEAIVRFGGEGPVLLLDRDGLDVRAVPVSWFQSDDVAPPPGPIGFVLSDHLPLAKDEQEAVMRESLGRAVSVGTAWLQGPQTVTLVHDELDRRAAAPKT